MHLPNGCFVLFKFAFPAFFALLFSFSAFAYTAKNGFVEPLGYEEDWAGISVRLESNGELLGCF